MNRDTKIIVGISGSGKTAELIKKSAESGIYILVANRKRAEMLVKQAENMKLYIPFPVTLQEWLRSDNRFHGSSIRRDGLLIDDIDDVIKELLLPIEIKAVTLRTPSAITNLDRNTDDLVKVVHASWKWGKVCSNSGYCCTNCGCGFTGENAEWIAKEHKYCPNCGAKMDGERSNNDTRTSKATS